PAVFDHLVAEHGIGNPGNHALEHVVVVELAGDAAGALRLRAVADFHGERDDFYGTGGSTEITARRRGVGRRQARLDEADRVGPDGELPIACVEFRDPDRLALRIQVPGGVAVDELGKALLALDREAGAAAARDVVALNADVF